MSDARWGDPRDYDARERNDEWPPVHDHATVMNTILGKP